MNNQPNTNVYNYLTQVQLLFSQLIQINTQLNLLEKNLEASNKAFNMIPTQQNLIAVQNTWDHKLTLMRQIPQIINNIAANLTEATRLALSSLQMNISLGNKINMVLNDNAIASICSSIEQNNIRPYLRELYRQYCITQNIPLQISNIDILSRMSKIDIPNFERLKTIINGN